MNGWNARIGTGLGMALAVGMLWINFGAGFFSSTEASSSAHTEREFRWENSLESGQTLEIKGFNGAITVSGGDSQATVFALIRGPLGVLGKVGVEAVETGDGVMFCRSHPLMGGADPGCASGEWGEADRDFAGVTITYTVSIPDGVNLIARTFNGAVRVQNTAGNVFAETVNGGIEVHTLGQVNARTVNGSISATMRPKTFNGESKFETVNGSIRVFVTPSFHGVVQGSTVSGSIGSDFPVTITDKRMFGRIGEGGGVVTLETVNGSVALKRIGSGGS